MGITSGPRWQTTMAKLCKALLITGLTYGGVGAAEINPNAPFISGGQTASLVALPSPAHSSSHGSFSIGLQAAPSLTFRNPQNNYQSESEILKGFLIAYRQPYRIAEGFGHIIELATLSGLQRDSAFPHGGELSIIELQFLIYFPITSSLRGLLGLSASSLSNEIWLRTQIDGQVSPTLGAEYAITQNLQLRAKLGYMGYDFLLQPHTTDPLLTSLKPMELPRVGRIEHLLTSIALVLTF